MLVENDSKRYFTLNWLSSAPLNLSAKLLRNDNGPFCLLLSSVHFVSWCQRSILSPDANGPFCFLLPTAHPAPPPPPPPPQQPLPSSTKSNNRVTLPSLTDPTKGGMSSESFQEVVMLLWDLQRAQAFLSSVATEPSTKRCWPLYGRRRRRSLNIHWTSGFIPSKELHHPNTRE